MEKFVILLIGIPITAVLIVLLPPLGAVAAGGMIGVLLGDNYDATRDAELNEAKKLHPRSYRNRYGNIVTQD